MDPVSLFGAQDEATYSRITLEMLHGHHWLAPTLLGRIAYFKPPLLYWLSGLSVEGLGASAYALRLPSILAGAGVCAIAFDWVARARGVFPGLFTVLLLAGDYFWITLGSLNMMDAPLAFLSVAALYAVARDPGLSRRQTQVIAGLLLGLAVLMKSVAALPAFAAIAAAALLSKTRVFPVIRTFGIAALAIAPWLGYTLATHFGWFWKEHVQTELFGHNVAGQAFSSPLTNVPFYFQRLVGADPLLAVIGAAAILWLVFRGRWRDVTLPLFWLTFCVLVLCTFGYRAATYLLPIMTALAIIAGFAVPRIPRNWAALMLVAILALQAGKLFRDSRIVWKGSNLTVAPALVNYCEQRRANALFVIETDDEFFSAALPLREVHYGLLNQGRAALRFAIDFQSLGIIVPSEEFDEKQRYWPTYRARLTAMGLPASLDPRATLVLFKDDEAIRRFISGHAELDFLVPKRYAEADQLHSRVDANTGHVLLLGISVGSTTPAWTCRLS